MGRSYNYPHVAALHWVFYRLARNHEGLVIHHPWDWYLERAFRTAEAMVRHAPRHAQFGQMEGTVFVLILWDLLWEDWNDEARTLENLMRARADHWRALAYPYGSEMPRLGEVARHAEPRIRFDRGTGRFETLGRTFAEALGTLIGVVLKAQIEGRLRRFKICDRAGCRAVYYDASKAGNGRWCTARCGDRVRAQAYRRSPKYKSRSHRRLR